MGNKRILKKGLNEMVFDIVDECYFIQIADPNKLKATEKLITEVADFQDDQLSKMNKAKGKAAFRAIHLQQRKEAAEQAAEADKEALLGNKKVVKCPQCGSLNTKLVSQFGSTACKALFQCEDCLEPFDYFKCLK